MLGIYHQEINIELENREGGLATAPHQREYNRITDKRKALYFTGLFLWNISGIVKYLQLMIHWFLEDIA